MLLIQSGNGTGESAFILPASTKCSSAEKYILAIIAAIVISNEPIIRSLLSFNLLPSSCRHTCPVQFLCYKISFVTTQDNISKTTSVSAYNS
jgi:hypothetical protein